MGERAGANLEVQNVKRWGAKRRKGREEGGVEQAMGLESRTCRSFSPAPEGARVLCGDSVLGCEATKLLEKVPVQRPSGGSEVGRPEPRKRQLWA